MVELSFKPEDGPFTEAQAREVLDVAREMRVEPELVVMDFGEEMGEHWVQERCVDVFVLAELDAMVARGEVKRIDGLYGNARCERCTS